MCRRTRCWRSDRDRVAIEELLRRWRAARRRSSSCRGCQAFVGEPLPPWPQLRLIVVPRERAGLNRGVPASRAEYMARRSDQRGQGPRPGPVPRAPRGLLHPDALNGRGRERVLSPSWPGPRCARPRAHAPGTQRPLPRSFARCRYLDRCRLLLSASAVLGAAKRLGAGLSLRPYFVARRQLLQRGPQRVELAAVEAWRCAPAPLTAPCACAMTPATLCTDPAPPDALTCRLTPSRPTAA